MDPGRTAGGIPAAAGQDLETRVWIAQNLDVAAGAAGFTGKAGVTVAWPERRAAIGSIQRGRSGHAVRTVRIGLAPGAVGLVPCLALAGIPVLGPLDNRPDRKRDDLASTSTRAGDASRIQLFPVEGKAGLIDRDAPVVSQRRDKLSMVAAWQLLVRNLGQQAYRFVASLLEAFRLEAFLVERHVVAIVEVDEKLIHSVPPN